MHDPLIGRQLGDYVIQRLLGRGGMARVYVGFDRHLQRYAAIKVINSDLLYTADRAEYAERFRREARAIARLHHPNIVGVYQFGEYEGGYYMAMVFVEGKDLRQILRDYVLRAERMPLLEVLNIVRGIGSALDYAHSRGVIHRDIKPSNIMVDVENVPVLTDFGLALSSSESTLGETFGSAHYIAPEQAVSSAKAVPQSDLYSLGVCVYEMLAGRVPFDDPSAMTVALKHLNDPPPPLRGYVPNISPAVEQVVLTALAKAPAARFASGADMAQSLAAAIFDSESLIASAPRRAEISVVHPDTDTADDGPRATRPFPRRGHMMLGLGALAVLLVALFLVLGIGRSPDARTRDSTPTGVPVAAPTDLPAASPAALMPTTTPSAIASLIATPILSATVPDTPTPTPIGQLLLVYDERQASLVNMTGSNVDVSRLVFVERSGDGLRQFNNQRWASIEGAARPADALPPGWCFQIGRLDMALPDIPPECRARAAYVRVAPSGWFWLGGTDFDVLWGERLLTTCPGGVGACRIDLPRLF
jgi:serine/threonine protein kinase